MKKISLVSMFIAGLAAASSFTTAASANGKPATGSDLSPTLVASGSTLVGTFSHFEVVVSNLGRKPSGAVSVTIQLPLTSTSPQRYLLGELAATPSGCSRSVATLTCSLPGIAKGASSAPIAFDVRLPYSIQPVNFSVNVSTNNDTNLGNNVLSQTAMQTYYSVPAPSTDFAATNSSCTGTNLSSYFECTLFPSSIQSHPVTFLANGSIALNEPGYSGTWSVSGTQLTFTYTNNGQPVGVFVGRGTSVGAVGQNCWEGKMEFIPASTYMAMYRTCF